MQNQSMCAALPQYSDMQVAHLLQVEQVRVNKQKGRSMRSHVEAMMDFLNVSRCCQLLATCSVHSSSACNTIWQMART